jgi:hypothetical protein
MENLPLSGKNPIEVNFDLWNWSGTLQLDWAGDTVRLAILEGRKGLSNLDRIP